MDYGDATKKVIASSLKLMLKLAPAILSWIAFQVFSINTWQFYIVIAAALSAWLLFAIDLRLSSLLATAGTIALAALLMLRADFYIFGDDLGVSYVSGNKASAVTLPDSTNILRPLAERWFPNKVVRRAVCAGEAVAVLPRAPVPLLRPDGLIVQGYFVGRRLPALGVERIGLNVDIGLHQVMIQPNSSMLTDFVAGVTVNHTTHPIPITSVFARSFNCQSDRMPLLPVLEYVSWTPSAMAELADAAMSVRQLMRAWFKGPVTAADLKELTSLHVAGIHGATLSFSAHAIAYHMIEGGLLAEDRANIIDSMCLLIRSYPLHFSGAFGVLRDVLDVMAIDAAGDNAVAAFPNCSPDRRLIAGLRNQREGNDSSLRAHAQAWSRCFLSKTDLEFNACHSWNNSVTATVPSNRDQSPSSSQADQRLTDESLVAQYERRFENVVYLANDLPTRTANLADDRCPKMRDAFEDTHALRTIAQRAYSALWASPSCGQADWETSTKQALRRLKAARECRQPASASSSAERAGTSVDLEHQRFLYLQCTHAANHGRNPNVFAILEPEVKLDISAEVFLLRLEQLRPWIANNRGQGSSAALKAVFETLWRVCGPRGLTDCFSFSANTAELHGSLIREILIREIALKSGIDVRKFDSTERDLELNKFRQLVVASDNAVLNMLACDLLGVPQISQLLELGQETFCSQKGLARYLLVRKIRLSQQTEFLTSAIARPRPPTQLQSPP